LVVGLSAAVAVVILLALVFSGGSGEGDSVESPAVEVPETQPEPVETAANSDGPEAEVEPVAEPEPEPEPEPEVIPEPEPGPEPELVAAPVGTTLTVLSEPSGCRVRLGRKTLEGRTPLEYLPLKPGRYKVTVACRRHRRQTKRIRLRKGQSRELSFKPRKLRKSRKSRSGYLRLVTTPWTEVFEGSSKLGVTPLAGVKMKPGKHKLRLVNHSKGISKTITVRIRSGKTTSIKKNL
jgi:hypothetical protein